MNIIQIATIMIASTATLPVWSYAQQVASSGCATAKDAADPLARRIATLNAVTAPVRENFVPDALPQSKVAGRSLDQTTRSTIAQRLRSARVISETFEQAPGKPGRLCLNILYAD